MLKEYIKVSLTDDNGKARDLLIQRDELEIEQIGGDERGMGAEVCYQLSYQSDELEMSCEIYEYPIGCFDYKSDWDIESNMEAEVLEDTIQYGNFFIEPDISDDD